MTAARRWCLVALGVLALVVAPVAVDAWPSGDIDESAESLVRRALAADVAYSGYVQSVGGLALPTTDQFAEMAGLFGGTNRLRVWWSDPDTWRVDRLGTAGETDLFHRGEQTVSWDYEGLEASSTPDAFVFLPRTVDLLPPQLGVRVLSGARPEELTRLPVERVAGHDAAGVRLTPSTPQASIDHVDVWVELRSALPVRVEVWGGATGSPSLATSFEDLSLDQPDPATVDFALPAGATFQSGGIGEDSLAGHVPDVYRSAGLAGLPRVDTGPLTLVGRYGTGVTQLLVLALDDEVADPLREQLGSTVGAVVDDAGTALGGGPLNLLLSPCLGDRPSWLLVGTVEQQTLRRAAARVYGAPRLPGARA